MTFSTLPGAGATDAVSLIGSSGIDIASVTSQSPGLFLNALEAGDVLNFTEAGNRYTVLGGEGQDTISGAPLISNSIINGNIGEDIIALDLLETTSVFGGKQNDFLSVGSLTSSSVNGNIGADAVTVTSGLSASQVYGGKDNDTLTVGGVISSSSVNGDIGNDTINLNVATLENGSSVQGGLNDDTITLTGVNVFSADSSVFGGQGNDTINAANSTAAVVIYGDNDNDTVTSGGGADFLYGNNGNDQLNGGASNDSLTGGAGTDSMTGGAGVDVMTGGTENDTFTGGAGIDTFNVDAGSDRILDVGAGGADNIVITAGATLTQGTVTADWTATAGTTNAGTATLVSNAQEIDISVALAGGANGFSITGDNTAGNGEILIGGGQADTISAGAGNDSITGGLGADNITVGAGNDVLSYAVAQTAALAANVDTITDFEVGNNVVDFTDLTNADLRGTGAGYEVVAAGANAVAANTGLVEQNGDLGDLLVATALTAANTMTGWATGDIVYFLGTNGTDTALYRISETTGNTVLDSAVLVATFTGVDETTFTAADFADFA